MAADSPNKAHTRSGSPASTAATSARSPTASTGCLPLTPAARGMPFWTAGSTCLKSGSTRHLRHCVSATACLRISSSRLSQLGLGMVQGLLERRKVPFRWVLADETYGADPKFLDGVEALGKWYFLEVPVTTRVWVGSVAIEPAGEGPMGRPRKYARGAEGTPKPREVRVIASDLPARAWRRSIIKEGTQGVIEAEFAFVRVTRS